MNFEKNDDLARFPEFPEFGQFPEFPEFGHFGGIGGFKFSIEKSKSDPQTAKQTRF